ncbi:MAG TPA: peptide-methionine (S)-S-oxide reductase MsrA [Candidatus Saccharimonadales bacterium]|nr:peptide-methionine (S)-S-oxide reductase MsrA [Candidatus Saccharimonadales bacterium]
MTAFVLGGGCFWCLDAVFRRLNGVSKSECGYAGGTVDQPNYYEVASGRTGHAEVVRVTFDETKLPAETLLEIYFLIHDPTTLNRQGADIGPQYRSIMLYEGEEQKQQFETALRHAKTIWDNPIVTELKALDTFYLAEPEHQDYFAKNPDAGYCSIVIAPKITKARRAYTKWFKEER